MREPQASKLTAREHWFRFWMPYAFVELNHPKLKHVWLPVNRVYKPIGVTSPKHVEYEDHIGGAIAFKRSPVDLDIWVNREPHLYLYNDGTRSRTDYFDRFARLMSQPQQLVAAAEAIAIDDRGWSLSGRQDLFLSHSYPTETT